MRGLFLVAAICSQAMAMIEWKQGASNRQIQVGEIELSISVEGLPTISLNGTELSLVSLIESNKDTEVQSSGFFCGLQNPESNPWSPLTVQNLTEGGDAIMISSSFSNMLCPYISSALKVIIAAKDLEMSTFLVYPTIGTAKNQMINLHDGNVYISFETWNFKYTLSDSFLNVAMAINRPGSKPSDDEECKALLDSSKDTTGGSLEANGIHIDLGNVYDVKDSKCDESAVSKSKLLCVKDTNINSVGFTLPSTSKILYLQSAEEKPQGLIIAPSISQSTHDTEDEESSDSKDGKKKKNKKQSEQQSSASSYVAPISVAVLVLSAFALF
jgi:hypothetical protein